MSTTVIEAKPKTETTALAFPSQEFDVDSLQPEVMALAMPDVNNKVAVRAVHDLRMRCVRMRTGIEKCRKEFKAPWIRGADAVDNEAKRLAAKLKPLEDRCDEISIKIEVELERIKKEAEDALFDDRSEQWAAVTEEPASRAFLLSFTGDKAFSEALTLAGERAAKKREAERLAAEQAEQLRKEQEELRQKQAEFEAKQQAIRDAAAKTQQRLRQLAAVKSFPEESEISGMTDEEFAAYRGARHEERAAQLREEYEAEQRQKQLQDRLMEFATHEVYPARDDVKAMTDEQFSVAIAKAKADMEERRRKQRELDAENERIAAENAERIRQEQLQKARDEAAERSRIETEERIKREQQAAEAVRLAEEARAAREAAMRPIKEKLADYRLAIAEVAIPEMGATIEAQVKAARNVYLRTIENIAATMEVTV